MEKARNVQKHFEFSKYENQMLKQLARTMGLKECDVIRDLVMNAKPVEAPGENFYDAINEIRKIGVNINQIAHVANAVGMVEANDFKREADKLDRLLIEIRKIVLEPHRNRDVLEIINEMEYMLWDTDQEQMECYRIQRELKALMGITKGESA